MPTKTRKRVIAFHENYYSSKSVYDERAMLEILPESMRTELVRCLYSKIMEEVPLFRGLSTDESTRIVLALQLYPVASDDVICKQNSSASEIFVIISGRIGVFRNGLGATFCGENRVSVGS